MTIARLLIASAHLALLPIALGAQSADRATLTRALDSIVTAEIFGEFRFKEFGIEPYSTMLGAIRNDDRFHLYVNTVARRAP